MDVLLFCAGLFLSSLLLQYIVWKIKTPRNPVSAILYIFMSVLDLGLILPYFLPQIKPTNYGFWKIVHISIVHISLTLNYIINFIALTDDSPSMSMIQFVAQAKEKGRTFDEFKQFMTNESLVLPRIHSMVADGWIAFRDSTYQVTQRGLFYYRLFSFWKKLLGLSEGG